MSFDVQQIVETAAKASYGASQRFNRDGVRAEEWDLIPEYWRRIFRAQARAALAVIVPAVTEQIRALHTCSDSNPGEAGRKQQEAGPWLGDCNACWLRYPCPTVRLLDELDAAARGDS